MITIIIIIVWEKFIENFFRSANIRPFYFDVIIKVNLLDGREKEKSLKYALYLRENNQM
jgi:hypothetical protein